MQHLILEEIRRPADDIQGLGDISFVEMTTVDVQKSTRQSDSHTIPRSYALPTINS